MPDSDLKVCDRRHGTTPCGGNKVKADIPGFSPTRPSRGLFASQPRRIFIQAAPFTPANQKETVLVCRASACRERP